MIAKVRNLALVLLMAGFYMTPASAMAAFEDCGEGGVHHSTVIVGGEDRCNGAGGCIYTGSECISWACDGAGGIGTSCDE